MKIYYSKLSWNNLWKYKLFKNIDREHPQLQVRWIRRNIKDLQQIYTTSPYVLEAIDKYKWNRKMKIYEIYFHFSILKIKERKNIDIVFQELSEPFEKLVWH